MSTTPALALAMPTTHEQWLALGVSKTVYSLPYPQVRAHLATVAAHVESRLARHDNPWEKKQDAMHDGLRAAWLTYAAKAQFQLGSHLTHFYPTAGASEAIRETIATIGARDSKKTSYQRPGIAIFEGEYEGYEAIALGLGMRVMKIPRAQWKSGLERAWNEGYDFFLSQPSAIDGNYWNEYSEFLAFANDVGGRVHLDVSYVGACERIVPISSQSPAIKSVFFSLSKPLGVYYRRIGGCFTAEANPLLYGNMWFKNLDSIADGEALLQEFDPGEMPRAWAHARKMAIERLEKEHGWNLTPCDVFLLAQGRGPGLAELARLPGGSARVCITPSIARAIEELQR